jgi:hypothetical protein
MKNIKKLKKLLDTLDSKKLSPLEVLVKYTILHSFDNEVNETIFHINRLLK